MFDDDCVNYTLEEFMSIDARVALCLDASGFFFRIGEDFTAH